MMKGEESSKSATEIISSIKSEEEEDGISSLPDCLLVDIISRSPETKEAIRTGTLSKRWQHLWPQVSNLIIEELRLVDYPEFYSSIERIISQRGQSNLNKFKLHTRYTYETESQVKNCIRNAINHNVQEVDLDVTLHPHYIRRFVLPEFFFITSSFIHLTLRNCIFKQAADVVVSWKHLKSLSITDASLNEDLIDNILSGSPLLETLELYNCYGFERLDITNKSVNNLVFSGYLTDLSTFGVEINAPYILSLTIQDPLLLSAKFLLLNMSSVIKAELDYYVDLNGDVEPGEEDQVNEETLKELLLSLGHVKEVKIGDYCLQALTGLKAKGFICPSNLKVLGEIDSM